VGQGAEIQPPSIAIRYTAVSPLAPRAFTSQMNIKNFFSEVKVELAKASWPWEPKEKGAKKYKELIDSTIIVVIAMLLLSGYVSAWDFVMTIVVGGLMK
jgi:preprotein translocase subunit SecE